MEASRNFKTDLFQRKRVHLILCFFSSPEDSFLGIIWCENIDVLQQAVAGPG